MTEQALAHDDEISLLDILVTLAESWKLLVLGPLVVGILAAGLSFLWPKNYESVAVVRLTEPELALLSAAPVLDPLIEKFGLLPEFDGIQEDARAFLAKKLVGKLDKKTGLATITATARTPERAQEMAAAGLDTLLQEMTPKGKNKTQIEQQIQLNERIINLSISAITQLNSQINKYGRTEQSMEITLKYFVMLTAEVANKEQENMDLKRSLGIRGEEVFVQRATSPKKSVGQGKTLVVLMSVLASGFGLLMFVFVRKAWAGAQQDAANAEKVARIKRLLGLARG